MKAMGMKKLRPRCIVGYPFHRINRVRFNPNAEQFHYFAMGYQAGFVRVKKIPQ
jgi:general transcription factor 3C polypeptide 2